MPCATQRQRSSRLRSGWSSYPTRSTQRRSRRFARTISVRSRWPPRRSALTVRGCARPSRLPVHTAGPGTRSPWPWACPDRRRGSGSPKRCLRSLDPLFLSWSTCLPYRYWKKRPMTDKPVLGPAVNLDVQVARDNKGKRITQARAERVRGGGAGQGRGRTFLAHRSWARSPEVQELPGASSRPEAVPSARLAAGSGRRQGFGCAAAGSGPLSGGELGESASAQRAQGHHHRAGVACMEQQLIVVAKGRLVVSQVAATRGWAARRDRRPRATRRRCMRRAGLGRLRPRDLLQPGPSRSGGRRRAERTSGCLSSR
jgi:hypothetical protein